MNHITKHQAKANSQNKAFENRVSQNQSLTGLANWNLTSPLSSQQIHETGCRGRQQIAKESTHLFRSAAKHTYALTKTLTSSILEGIQTYRQNKASATVLLSLDQDTLEDIGISRADAIALASRKVSIDDFNTTRSKIRHAVSPILKQTPSSWENKPDLAEYPQKVSAQQSKAPSANDSKYAQKCA